MVYVQEADMVLVNAFVFLVGKDSFVMWKLKYSLCAIQPVIHTMPYAGKGIVVSVIHSTMTTDEIAKVGKEQ